MEQDAQLTMMMEHPALWRVINPNVKSPLGYPTGYEIAPMHNAVSLMTDDDYPQRRAGFILHNLWVTPYREDERYAAGDYPTQSHGGDGLPAWTKNNRPLKIPTSWCGTRWASTMSRARRIVRSCRQPGMNSSCGRSISFREIQLWTCRERSK